MPGKRKRCRNCGNKIRVMIFRNSEWCSELCRKILAAEYNQ